MSTDPSQYMVMSQDPADISGAEIDRMAAILAEGGAVDADIARETLRHCRALFVARTASEIVGVGAVKPPRLAYTAGVQRDSGILFDLNTPELGYVAVAQDFRGRKISREILRSLLGAHPFPVFCTTDAPEMHHLLPTFGFTQAGQAWQGNRGILTCWVSSGVKWQTSSWGKSAGN